MVLSLFLDMYVFPKPRFILVGATKPLEEVENMSFLGKYSCGNTTVPIYLSFSTAVCSTLISIVATVGNSFVVLAVFLNPN